MSDLISRADAIDAILHNQEVYSNNFGDDPIDKYTTAIISNDVQTIVQLPSAQQWIPCSERLPDMHDEVLVTARGEVSIAWLYVDGKWRSTDMPPSMFRDIVAWMPLPEPYKEVTE